MFVWKRPKINKKEAGDGPFLKKNIQTGVERLLTFNSSSRCYKTFFRGNMDFPNIKELKKFVLVPEPALNWEKVLFLNKSLL